MGEGQKTAVLVPIKPFALAKSRLAGACTNAQREAIARSMARNVLQAASGLRTAVVSASDATDVRRFALINGARFFAEPEVGGVNGAVMQGVAELREHGYDRVVVVHSDLPLVRDLSWLANSEGITVVADRSGRGTNAISLPTEAAFDFSFGPDSFGRHQAEASRLGFACRGVVDPDGVSADVDDIEDAMRTGVFLPEGGQIDLTSGALSTVVVRKTASDH